MKNAGIFFSVLILVSSCDNSLQLALPGLLTTRSPSTNPAPGLYKDDLTEIELLSQTEGAEIYYTTDTTEPGRSSQRYLGPLSLEGHHSELYIRAVAYKDGKDPSPEMTAFFHIEYGGPEAPSLDVEKVADSSATSPRGDGTFEEDIRVSIIPETAVNESSESLWITQGKSVSVLYTTDGTTPMANDAGTPTGTTEIYSGQTFTVTGSSPLTLKTRSSVAGFPASSVLTATYEVRYDQSLNGTVEFSEAEGTKYEPFDLTLTVPSGSPSGTEIYYSIQRSKNGSTTESGPDLYSTPISLFTEENTTEEVTVTAWLELDQWQDSAEITRHYSFSQAQPQPPEIRVLVPGYEVAIERPQGYTIDQYCILVLESNLEGDIYYTVDDSIPDSSSYLYTGSFYFPGNLIDWSREYVVINAVVIRGGVTSPIGSSWYLLPE